MTAEPGWHAPGFGTLWPPCARTQNSTFWSTAYYSATRTAQRNDWSRNATGSAASVAPRTAARCRTRRARFDPLDLDFTTAGGAASRVLLSLTNTGGKSTLITLISSLVVRLPGRRSEVRTSATTSSPATPRMSCASGTTPRPGCAPSRTVMEWKDGRRQPPHKQRSTTNMHRAWYLFRTGPQLPGIDDLPFVVEGRRAVFSTYLDNLTELLTRAPATQWVLTRTQQEWTQALEDHTCIDPVLFGYQMRMNDSEAGAERLCAISTHQTTWCGSSSQPSTTIATSPTSQANSATTPSWRLNGHGCKHLTTSASQSPPPSNRSRTEPSPPTRPPPQRFVCKPRARNSLAPAYARLTQDRFLLAEQEQELQTATQAVATARREYGQISDIRLQLLLEEARARADAARAEVKRRTEAARNAQQEASAWHAVNTVLDVQTARARRDSAQLAYDHADAGLGPLRARAEAATASLAARLDGLARELQSTAEAADMRAEEARTAERKAKTAEKMPLTVAVLPAAASKRSTTAYASRRTPPKPRWRRGGSQPASPQINAYAAGRTAGARPPCALRRKANAPSRPRKPARPSIPRSSPRTAS